MENYLNKTKEYFTKKLIPFWADRAVEPKFGGFQTNYDRDGKRTDVTEKTLLAQCRAIFTIAHTLRLGFRWPSGYQSLKQGIDFLFRHFYDKKYNGYYWILTENGTVADDNKIIYGHSFLIYALSEYALLTGDQTCKSEAVRIFDLLQDKAADKKHGGYYEHFDRFFNLKKARKDFTTNKSLDVHMHLMEAFATLYELTKAENHRLALEKIIDLIFTKMIDPETGAGISMFTENWIPIPNIELETVWGSDRFEAENKSTDITSYGHNIELAWLYLHAQDILGVPLKNSIARVLPIFEHTYSRGVDWEYGGLYVEGSRQRGPTEQNKEFWQQAEALVGFLDAYLFTSEKKYLKAFGNIHDFVFTKFINQDLGEWYALLDRKGDIIWDYLGSSWKIFYHTVRGTSLVIKKLEKILNKNGITDT